MPHYLATGRYATVVRGRRGDEVRYSWAPGDVVEIPQEHIRELVRAGAPVDFDRPLSAVEAGAAKAKREAAEAEQAAREAAAKRYLREWTEAWGGPRCPGSPGATVIAGDKPHNCPADPFDKSGRTGLLVRWRTQPDHIDGGWFVVGCWHHIGAWQRHDLPPPPLPARDRQVRTYRLTRDYSAIIGSPYDLARDPATRLLIVDNYGRVRWREGDTVRLPGWLATQIERDSPGVLQLLGPDGHPAEPAPSTEDTTAEAGEATESETTAEAKPRKTAVRAKVG